MTQASNLPPGIGVGDIPGNRPEDDTWEAFMDRASDRLAALGSVEDADRAVLMGVAALLAGREVEQEAEKAALLDAYETGRARGRTEALVNTPGRIP